MTISFSYNRQKAFQVILWFLQRHGGSLDKLKLVKLIFFADREHLRRYGRPVVGGRYVAMDHGPVPSECLDDINSSSGPFELVRRYLVVSQEPPEEEFLSESDLEALEETNARYGRIDSFRLAGMTHLLTAWRDTYRKGTSSPLPYEDWFKDLDDPEMLELIQEDQEAYEPLNS